MPLPVMKIQFIFLSVSPDDAAQALQLLADWAYQIEFDENELNTEREVVLNEERIRRSDHAIYQSIYKTIYPNQNYANRMPIGDSKTIKSIPLEKINAFYQREYQAQKMAILVSGDINPRQIETQIKKKILMPCQPAIMPLTTQAQPQSISYA
ncbi:pitrilysin family protein [Deefgea sp. CFH1-16]|uniref:M16 family metallopeptidase n=1 Tax=Deefgea sp. CFH1-16 TaxID=2675457 RepID=UPI00194035CE|nr:insulinase family protein [Deefgea sp. CFH1-16]